MGKLQERVSMRPGFVFAVLLGAAIPAAAGGLTDLTGKAVDEYGFAIRGRAWMSDQESAAQDSTENQPGSVIDFDDDLDLTGDPFIPDLEIEYRTKELAFHLHGWYANESHTEQTEEDEAFDGSFIPAGEEVTGRFRIIQTALHFEWIPIDLGSSKKIGLEVGVILGVRFTEFDARIRRDATGDRLKSDVTAALPDIGATLNVGLLNFLELEVQVSGFGLDVSGYDYLSINGSAELRIFLDEHFYFGAGYRFSSGSLERDDADEDGRVLEYEYHGPMVTLGVQF
jgi:hypothetical protein